MTARSASLSPARSPEQTSSRTPTPAATASRRAASLTYDGDLPVLKATLVRFTVEHLPVMVVGDCICRSSRIRQAFLIRLEAGISAQP
jgi:hypothetical protein